MSNENKNEKCRWLILVDGEYGTILSELNQQDIEDHVEINYDTDVKVEVFPLKDGIEWPKYSCDQMLDGTVDDFKI